MQTQKYFRLLLVWRETSNNWKYVCVRRLQPILPLTRFKVLNSPTRYPARRRWIARGCCIRRHPVVWYQSQKCIIINVLGQYFQFLTIFLKKKQVLFQTMFCFPDANWPYDSVRAVWVRVLVWVTVVCCWAKNIYLAVPLFTRADSMLSWVRKPAIDYHPRTDGIPGPFLLQNNSKCLDWNTDMIPGWLIRVTVLFNHTVS